MTDTQIENEFEETKPVALCTGEDDANPAGTDSAQIGRCLLPVLRCVAGVTESDADENEKEIVYNDAAEEIARHADTYRNLTRLWESGDESERRSIFGFLTCTQEKLAEAFSLISRRLAMLENGNGGSAYGKEKTGTAPGNGRELLFISMFRITDASESVNLAYPFEQYYFCDKILYRDYVYRRYELGEKCKAWLRRYRQYYVRIENAYREESANEGFCLPEEYVFYMDLIDYYTKQILYEDGLTEKKQALEYERGGLGWFNFRRKKEIARELLLLHIEEIKLRLDAVREKCDAYGEQFEEESAQWKSELARAPFTAFARKKELKAKLATVQEKTEAFRQSQKLYEIEEEYQKALKKYR